MLGTVPGTRNPLHESDRGEGEAGQQETSAFVRVCVCVGVYVCMLKAVTYTAKQIGRYIL